MTTKTYDEPVANHEVETEHHYEELDKIWLEERSLTNSLAQPLRGLLGFFLSFGFFMALWYVTMDTRNFAMVYTDVRLYVHSLVTHRCDLAGVYL